MGDLQVRSEEAVFLANELATNAIVHAGGEFLVEVAVDDSTCRIGVIDHDFQVPEVEGVGHDATRGRGLALVEAMSSSWGVEQRGDGKSVWCEVIVKPFA